MNDKPNIITYIFFQVFTWKTWTAASGMAATPAYSYHRERTRCRRPSKPPA